MSNEQTTTPSHQVLGTGQKQGGLTPEGGGVAKFLAGFGRSAAADKVEGGESQILVLAGRG
jgi:hypothetical protein